MIDKTNGIVQELPLRKTEKVRAREIKPGDYVISENSAGVKFYRLVARAEDVHGHWTLTYDENRYVSAEEDPRKPGFCENLAGIPTGGHGYGFLPDSPVERVTDLDGVHLAYMSSGKLGTGGHTSLDRLVDGRIIWDIGSHVHGKTKNLLVRFNTEDDYVQVPLGSIALLSPKR